MDAPRLITPVPGPRSRELAERLRAVETRNLTFISHRWPVVWASGSGCAVEDVDGNRFLDLTAAFGVAVLGHAHPLVAAAVAQQAARLPHGMGDVHPPLRRLELAERLTALAPGALTHCLLATSGADAVEAACKTARLASGRAGILVMEGAYHGLTLGTLPLTHREDFRAPFADQIATGHVARVPYGVEGLVEAEALLEKGEIGAVLLEPILGRGGVVVPHPGFLRQIETLTRRSGALLVLDEIFTGLGRTGTWFALEESGIQPDLLVVGKALGGGLPIGAVLGTAAALDSWPESEGEALHTSTFLGNPTCCAAALATLEVLEQDRLPDRARQAGEHLGDRLRELQRRHPEVIHEVRGRGLMWGLEVGPFLSGARVAEEALGLGLLVLPAGPEGQVVQLTPPLVITDAELERGVELLEEALLRAARAARG